MTGRAAGAVDVVGPVVAAFVIAVVGGTVTRWIGATGV
jgi:hypothetical protein